MSMESTPTVAPEEAVIMPVEQFIEQLKEQFAELPFVAVSVSRSMTIRPNDQPGAKPHMASYVAVGFQPEYLADVPRTLSLVSGVGSVVLSTDDDAIAKLIADVFPMPSEADARLAVAT